MMWTETGLEVWHKQSPLDVAYWDETGGVVERVSVNDDVSPNFILYVLLVRNSSRDCTTSVNDSHDKPDNSRI